MNRLAFEWDEDKAESNARKHGVSFETAMRVFFDPYVLTRQDRIEGHEERWQAMGMMNAQLILFVAYMTWEEDNYGEFIEVIRIISARQASGKERRQYDAARYANRPI